MTAPIGQKMIWGALLLVLFGSIGYFAFDRLYRRGTWPPREQPPPPPELDPLRPWWDAPDFELTESSGRTVTREDLRGRIWIADFIFTSCGGQCPTMTRAMATLQDEFRDVWFVSFTVDPAVDTPEVLAAYADRYGADRDRWWFVTGEKAQLYQICGKDGFRLAVEDRPMSEFERVTHSNRLMLVDRDGKVRGSYPGDDEEALRRLRDDLRRIRAEP